MEIEHCHDATNYIVKKKFFFTPNVMLSKISGENTVYTYEIHEIIGIP